MTSIRETLDKLAVKPSKGRGQNFLQNSHDAEILIKAIGINAEDNVIEIGPGLGALTDHLIKSTNNLVCIEIEDSFIKFLREKYKCNDMIYFINQDFRTVKLNAVNLGKNGNHHFKIISNLPYVFSTDAILWLIENIKYVKIAGLLVQKEFGERIAGTPNSKSYGSISVYTQFFFDVSLGHELSGDAFFPKAGVPSQQIILYPRMNIPKLASPFTFFEEVVRASFSMRRKKLINCISNKIIDFDKTSATKVLNALGFNENIRAENLSIDDFCKLSDSIYDFKNKSR